MADETTYGRKTRTIVELTQPRCVHRFGSAPCTASGTPKCYQTWGTCKDLANYDPSGSITWRFSKPNENVGWLYEADGANDIKTNALPFLSSVTAFSSTINVGAAREGESPLGVNAVASIVMDSPPWDDHVGDFYIGDRSKTPNAPFWSMWDARNPLYPNMTIRIYQGYAGQSLDDMQVRSYDLENVEGPSSSDQWTLTARDPLDKIKGDKAKYPPTSDIELVSAINESATTMDVVCVESELTATYGNVSTKYIIIGSEIISFGGYTGTEPEFTLTNCQRGVLDTETASHDEGDAVQRVARFEQYPMYRAAEDIIKSPGTIPDSYIPSADWTEEGDRFLSTMKCTATISSPENVDDLAGELCRDGLFSIFWDDRAQEIRLLAVKPPQETPTEWNDSDNIIMGSFSRSKDPDERMSRVSVYFGRRDPLASIDDTANYKNRRIYIDGDVESAEASGGVVIENVIYSRWISTASQALLVGASLVLRYRLPPEYATVEVDAKDRSAQMGGIIDLTSRHILDTEGNQETRRWQIRELTETVSGERLQAGLQSYQSVGKFAIITPNDAPAYADASDTERESGCWLADDATGRMPDGTEPYLLQ